MEPLNLGFRFSQFRASGLWGSRAGEFGLRVFCYRTDDSTPDQASLRGLWDSE